MTSQTPADPNPPGPFEGALDRDELLAYKLQLDERIEVGRIYRLRPTTQRSWLFHGKPMRLLDIRLASHCFRLRFDLSPEEIMDPADVRCLCVYTDSWEPGALALTLVPKESARRMMHMMARSGLDPGMAAYPAGDPRNEIDAPTRAILEAARKRCERCSAEGHCDDWLAGRAEGDDAFCPNAPSFRELAGRRSEESEE